VGLRAPGEPERLAELVVDVRLGELPQRQLAEYLPVGIVRVDRQRADVVVVGR
jgi:hypothetical protein